MPSLILYFKLYEFVFGCKAAAVRSEKWLQLIANEYFAMTWKKVFKTELDVLLHHSPLETEESYEEPWSGWVFMHEFEAATPRLQRPKQ